MNLKLKTAYVATLLALGTTASAERMIVKYDDMSKAAGLKRGHEVLVEGNGWFAVDLDEAGKSAMMAKNGFKAMELDHVRSMYSAYSDDAGDPNSQQLTPYAVYQSQADQLNLQPGQKVCVIDSGLDRSNPDFNWGAITGDNDSGTGNWDEHGGPHGTHVAGTVGAADNGVGVIGLAPGVSMHIIKVFNESGWGYSSDLAYAANKCSAAGANIITMSLGGGGANSTEENAFQSFTDNGGLVLAAAGNDGNSVRSYPAGYKSVMMIGANDNDNNIASFSQFPPNTKTSGRGKRQTTETHDGFGVEVTAGGVATLSTYPAGMASLATLEVDGAGVAASATDNIGNVSGSTYFMGTAEVTDSGANGKVCLIDRGNISFADKINNCANSGGVGAVVINNEPGMIYMDITGVTTGIPAVGAANEDRGTILAAATATINSGSSDYGYMDGTSMATPAAAGAAALIWSNHPTCTGTEIREAMKATADDQGTAGRDDYFGYGIVKAKAASDYLTANGCQGGDTGGPTDPPAGDELVLSGNRSNGDRRANLSWTGGSTANVDVYVNGTYNNTTANDGAVTYNVDKNTSYTFQICEEGSTTSCSNEITL